MKKPVDIRENVAAGIRRGDVRAAAKRLLEELPTLAGEAPIENVTRAVLEDLVALVRERAVAELDEAGRVLPKSLKLDDVVRAFQAIRRNDETRFEHHQKRSWDGCEPTSPASRWAEPRELAIAALKALGAKVPDPIEEALAAKSHRKAKVVVRSLELEAEGPGAVEAATAALEGVGLGEGPGKR